MDLHAGQLQGFFDIPVDNLHGRSQLIQAVKSCGLAADNCVVVTPDVGSIKIARAYSSDLHAEFAIINKHRSSATKVDAVNLIGDVKGKDVLLADDMCSTGANIGVSSESMPREGSSTHLSCSRYPRIICGRFC